MRGGRTGWVAVVALLALGAIGIAPRALAMTADGSQAILVVTFVMAVIAAVPASLILRWLVPEMPSRLTAVAVLVGALPAIAATHAASRISPWSSPAPSIEELLFRSATIPPIVEELVKSGAIVLVLLALPPAVLVTRRHGKVAGAAVGLGFTVAETAIYVAAIYDGGSNVPFSSQFALRFGLLGLSGHALTSTLAGVGIADAWQARGRNRVAVAAPWIAAAIVAHASMNSLGALVHALVAGPFAPADDAFEVPAGIEWLSMVASFVAAQAWAVILLWLRGRTRLAPVAVVSGMVDPADRHSPDA